MDACMKALCETMRGRFTDDGLWWLRDNVKWIMLAVTEEHSREKCAWWISHSAAQVCCNLTWSRILTKWIRDDTADFDFLDAWTARQSALTDSVKQGGEGEEG